MQSSVHAAVLRFAVWHLEVSCQVTTTFAFSWLFSSSLLTFLKLFGAVWNGWVFVCMLHLVYFHLQCVLMSLSVMPCLHLIENDIVHWPFVQNLNTFRHGNEFAPTVGFFLTTHPSEVLLPIGLKHVYWLQRGYLYRVFFIGLKCILFFELLTVHHLYAKENCLFLYIWDELLNWSINLLDYDSCFFYVPNLIWLSLLWMRVSYFEKLVCSLFFLF